MHTTVPAGLRQKHGCKRVSPMKQSLSEAGWICESSLVFFLPILRPLDKEQSVLVRILKSDEAAAPTFIRRRPNLGASVF
jgi:hypothetical protein